MWPDEETAGWVANSKLTIGGRCSLACATPRAPVHHAVADYLFALQLRSGNTFRGQRNVMNWCWLKASPKASSRSRLPTKSSKCDRFGRLHQRWLYFWKTIGYFLGSTGIPINFGITIGLGFIVGVAIAGQTFYLFTVENLRQFGTIKEMGVSNGRLVKMILLQAAAVGVLGYALGVGGTALFFESTASIPPLAGIHMSWQTMAGVGGAVLTIVLLASVLSLRRVLVLEPAIVFRG